MIKKVVQVALVSCLFIGVSQANTIESSLKTCADIVASTERLACYDKLAKTFKTPKVAVATQAQEVAKPAAIVAPVVSQEQKEAEFGDHHLKKDKKPNELDRVQFTIAKISYSGKKKLKLTFENGQRWNQSDTETLRLKVGDKVELFKGAWSAIYLKKVGFNRKIRVKRVK
ncbi:hypothetical protein [Thalassotalea eurytherma]|uniref:Uncharacterized protein n=1 Tax=Thalassotalea eurytherma TaxID=1144278 RepID=A0ABQ6H0T2_9GAMM|nr:hypothetical protein [Thalassotalea eurytherma]GLX80660.1 hypothetical protein theurythT_01120 [Thalassotalea eurytherma]